MKRPSSSEVAGAAEDPALEGPKREVVLAAGRRLRDVVYATAAEAEGREPARAGLGGPIVRLDLEEGSVMSTANTASVVHMALTFFVGGVLVHWLLVRRTLAWREVFPRMKN